LRGRRLEVTLVLEHRFAPTQLSALDDREIGRWVTLCALAEPRATESSGQAREDSVPATALQPVVMADGVATTESANDSIDPAQLEQSLGALQTNDWNISRAARHLGLTRHGLKKRMRRLGIRRPPHSAPANDDAD
jgi:transcriptional regulator with GAF, ATPase, and Fis domain